MTLQYARTGSSNGSSTETMTGLCIDLCVYSIYMYLTQLCARTDTDINYYDILSLVQIKNKLCVVTFSHGMLSY